MYIILYCIISYHTISYHIILYYVILYDIILYIIQIYIYTVYPSLFVKAENTPSNWPGVSDLCFPGLPVA